MTLRTQARLIVPALIFALLAPAIAAPQDSAASPAPAKASRWESNLSGGWVSNGRVGLCTRRPAAKERAIKARGDQQGRTELWRFAGVDLTRIDGISTRAAQLILTEVGPDISAFPSEHHFVSWLRLCPRTPISGGQPLKKRRNGLGANRIAGVLRMAATSLQRSKTALGAAFRRIARHKGGAVAVFATARQLALLVYRMLRHGQDYVDIGAEAYEAKFQARRLASLHETARSLGYTLMEAPTDES